MAWVAVNKDGTEVIGENLQRARYKNYFLQPIDSYRFPVSEATEWAYVYDDLDNGYQNIAIELPKGTIKKLIGKELSWEDEPVELK